MNQQSKKLSDTYVKLVILNSLMYKGADITYKDLKNLPYEVIEAKRIQLQAKRNLKEILNEKYRRPSTNYDGHCS